MTLKKYVKRLQALAKKYPKAVVVYEDVDVFKRVKCFPMRGNFKKGRFNGLTINTFKVNAVCLN